MNNLPIKRYILLTLVLSASTSFHAMDVDIVTTQEQAELEQALAESVGQYEREQQMREQRDYDEMLEFAKALSINGQETVEKQRLDTASLKTTPIISDKPYAPMGRQHKSVTFMLPQAQEEPSAYLVMRSATLDEALNLLKTHSRARMLANDKHFLRTFLINFRDAQGTPINIDQALEQYAVKKDKNALYILMKAAASRAGIPLIKSNKADLQQYTLFYISLREVFNYSPLIVASKLGKTNVIQALKAAGAKAEY